MIAKRASCNIATSKVTTRDAKRASCKLATNKVTNSNAKNTRKVDAPPAR